MFLSIVRTNGEPGNHNESVGIYECSRVLLGSHEDKEGDHDSLFVTLEGASDITIEIHKPTTAMYLMNNDGKTIDRWRWNPEGKAYPRG